MQSNGSSTSKMFLAVIELSGIAVLANALLHPSSADHVRFVSFLLVACLAARLKVKCPGSLEICQSTSQPAVYPGCSS